VSIPIFILISSVEGKGGGGGGGGVNGDKKPSLPRP
jgi:hypothetical protein